MAFLSSFDISGTGMTAQKLRMDIIAQNIANAQSTRTESGQPYKRKTVVLQSVDLDATKGFRSELSRAINEKASGAKNSTAGMSAAAGAKAKTVGVQVADIVEDNSDFIPVYNPEHPDADENGYVRLSNVNTTQEMIDMMAASRAFESNVTAFNAIKSMALKALELGR